MCSMFLPRSSRRTLRPFSVSSLAAHPPEIPEPTTIASYCVDCIRFLVWERERDDLCLPNAPDNLSVDEPPRYLRGPGICIIRCPPRPPANPQRNLARHMEPHAALSPWESFYVIVGSSAAALTGLQFVVMALIADTSARAGTHEIGAFATPNIVHFCAVLLFSAILSAPWPSLHAVAVSDGHRGAVRRDLRLHRVAPHDTHEDLQAGARGLDLARDVAVGRARRRRRGVVVHVDLQSVLLDVRVRCRVAAAPVRRDSQRVGHDDVHHDCLSR